MSVPRNWFVGYCEVRKSERGLREHSRTNQDQETVVFNPELSARLDHASPAFRFLHENLKLTIRYDCSADFFGGKTQPGKRSAEADD